MIARVDTAQASDAAASEPHRFIEKDRAIYVYETTYGRCVAFARRRVSDQVWEVKLTGPDQPVYVAEHRGRARGKLRRLVAGIGGGS